MPTIFFKTFPATAPMPQPTELEIPFSLDASSSAAAAATLSPTSLAASPTSVIGHSLSPSHRREGSLHGFILPPGQQHQDQRFRNSNGKTPLTSPPPTLPSPPKKTIRVDAKSSPGNTSDLRTSMGAADCHSNQCGGSEDSEQEWCANEWICPVSEKAKRTNTSLQDAIRPIASKIQMGFQRIDRKDPISLASADATLTHISPCTKAMEAVVKATLYKPHAAGYTHATGSVEARRAIALHHSSPEYQMSSDHVIVTNGCSGALDLILETILDKGTTLLVPCPGFPLYQELGEKHGAEVAEYRLDPNKRWECDIDHLEQIMSSLSNVRALVINNPSSPTGSVFSERHLEDILSFASRHRLLIISDEVYGTLTFGANEFHPMAQIAARLGRQVPIVTASGLSKQFMVPGWRVGWLAFQDNTRGSLRNVEQGATRLIQSQHGVNQLAQSAIAPLLSASTPGLADWKERFRSTLEQQGVRLCSNLNNVHCLKVAPPQGAMYSIVHIRFDRLNSTITNDIEFATKLVEEENVFVLPGSTFGVPGTFRVAYSASEQTLVEASNRISNFCTRYARSFYTESYGFASTNFRG